MVEQFFFPKILSASLSRVSNGLDLDQDPHSVNPDRVQTVCKGCQQILKVDAIKERVKR